MEEEEQGEGREEEEKAEESVSEPAEKADDERTDEKSTESETRREGKEGESGSGSEESEEEEKDDGGGEEDAGQMMASREEKMARLRELHRRRLEARQLNHREVVEEDRRSKLPANWESRQRKVEWEEEDEKARQEAEAAGEDYEREKMMKTSASELERLQRKKKKNPDPGFTDYAQAQLRKYERLTKHIQPDMEAYQEQKLEMGADFYPGVNSLTHGGAGKVSKEALERMTQDLAKQVEKRSKFSRRRPHADNQDVDYINDRNMRFNRKAARYYDKYTAEIKQNLERGTAI
ncbi:Pre-mRNA-splicing factor syf2 [Geodia barretti]|uniref:Pre-mRNA-splicing factor SYF2 n=1 Tax=Geodia barretti TaxID=519541 RepID=A0AA35TKX4_GEOBA|nr:Pre-mRNA-splicing factor syf2 [Geodia barretti]